MGSTCRPRLAATCSRKPSPARRCMIWHRHMTGPPAVPLWPHSVPPDGQHAAGQTSCGLNRLPALLSILRPSRPQVQVCRIHTAAGVPPQVQQQSNQKTPTRKRNASLLLFPIEQNGGSNTICRSSLEPRRYQRFAFRCWRSMCCCTQPSALSRCRIPHSLCSHRSGRPSPALPCTLPPLEPSHCCIQQAQNDRCCHLHACQIREPLHQ